MTSVAISAVKPWHSVDSVAFNRQEFTTYDDQDQIELCMSCPFADDCHDCVTTERRRSLMLRLRKLIK